MRCMVVLIGSYLVYAFGAAIYHDIAGKYPWPATSSHTGLWVWLGIFILLFLGSKLYSDIRKAKKNRIAAG